MINIETSYNLVQGKALASNATSTAFSAKSLTVLGQYTHTEAENEVGIDSERPIKTLFNNLKNSNPSVRLAALSGVKDLMTSTKNVNHVDELLKRLPVVMTSEESDVRSSSIELVKIMLDSTRKDVIKAFVSSISALCTNILSHISWAVKIG